MKAGSGDNLADILNAPLAIGNKKIKNRLFLAPMAGPGEIAFRELVEFYGGCGLLFTGMCNAKPLPRENRYKSPVFRWRDEELPRLVCQLFGNEPRVMALGALRVEKEGFFGVDINMGCSVAAICKKNCGAALLKNPDLAVKVAKAVVDAVSIPVFVKFRSGWNDDPYFAGDLAKRFEDIGVQVLTFHPRVAPDRRSRPPKWDKIRIVKESVALPVFGNGNVFDENDCLKMIKTTGCDGVSLGRIAVAKPWVFSEWTGAYIPDGDTYKNCALKMVEILSKHYEPKRAVKLFKKFAIYFSANFKFGLSIYKKICKGSNPEEVEENILKIFENCPDILSRPNFNLFQA